MTNNSYQQPSIRKVAPLIFIMVFLLLGGYLLVRSSSASSTSIYGDINGDGIANISDLSIMLGSFGQTGSYAQGDINSNGKVDVADLSILLTHFGKSDPITTAPVSGPTSGPVTTNTAGHINFVLRNSGATDKYNNSTDPAAQKWINDHYWRQEVFHSYFWNKASWYQKGWDYKDSTSAGGIETISQHRDWILKDAAGNDLYIPWGCNDGCDAKAVDVGNPAMRQEWINEAKASINANYKGLWIDDVNMDFRVSDINGNSKLPVDPRTGTTMTQQDWRKYLADFMTQIRTQMPAIEILHNNIYYAGGDTGQYDNDPYIIQEIKAANYINREGGFNDGGMTGGTGPFSVNKVMAYADHLHSLGVHMIIDSFTKNLTDREYGLAGYFMINDGGDGYGNQDASYPDNWWSGYDIDLGSAKGIRYQWNGMLRRDFDNGIVLMNDPWGATHTNVPLGATYTNTSGQSVTSVTLLASQGAILRK